MNYLPEKIEDFKKTVWEFYNQNKREFAWRQSPTPYAVVVSEIMLQQTQTARVKDKFAAFTAMFGSFDELAAAPVQAVLKEWVGLGYNRRALALHGIAQKIVHEYGGILPNDVEVLRTFKGLGHATASSIVAFAYNKPTVFIETNIRAVFIHTFYPQLDEVHDKELMPLIDLAVDMHNPREWYYALMDYGVHLKKLHKNPSRKSRHHTVQSKFEGSDRQIRGAIVRTCTQDTVLSLSQLKLLLPFDVDRIEQQYNALVKEGFISKL